MGKNMVAGASGAGGGRGSYTSKTAALRMLWNNLLPSLRQQAADIAGAVAESGWKTATGNEESARKVGKATGKTVKIGMTASANIKDFGRVFSRSRGKLKQLTQNTTPVLEDEFGHASRLKLMRSKNEVIAVQRARIMADARNGFYIAGVGLLDKAPDVVEYAEQSSSPLAGVAKKISADTAETMLRTGVPVLQGYIAAQGQKKHAKPSAYEMIVDLARQMDSSGGRLEVVLDRAKDEHKRLDRFVAGIFKRHQRDVGATPIEAGFAGLDAFESAVQAIATEIQDKRLNPMALVALVGERKIVGPDMQIADAATVQAELQRVGEYTGYGHRAEQAPSAGHWQEKVTAGRAENEKTAVLSK